VGVRSGEKNNNKKQTPSPERWSKNGTTETLPEWFLKRGGCWFTGGHKIGRELSGKKSTTSGASLEKARKSREHGAVSCKEGTA